MCQSKPADSRRTQPTKVKWRKGPGRGSPQGRGLSFLPCPLRGVTPPFLRGKKRKKKEEEEEDDDDEAEDEDGAAARRLAPHAGCHHTGGPQRATPSSSFAAAPLRDVIAKLR